MVVFFPRPPSTTYMRRSDSWDSDDDDPSTRYYYVRLEDDSSDEEEEKERPTARGRRRRNHYARLILEEEDDEEEETDDDWNPLLHIDELPLRPMSRFRKACVDVLFVAATVALEGSFVWAGLQDGADKVNWFIDVPAMLLFMIVCLYLIAFFHLLVTRDFEARPPFRPAAADEAV